MKDGRSAPTGRVRESLGIGPEIAVPFLRFAPYYDRFMVKYVNYPAWVQYVRRIFRRHACAPKLILDLACGTGLPTMLLAGHGYRLIGLDRSAAMLAVLRGKIGRHDIRLIQADMRDFTLPEPADAAICLYDSLNYLLTQDDLARCFDSVARNLKPDGLFTFDMNTVHGLAFFWGNRTTTRDVAGVYSVWKTAFDPETRISSLQLTFYVAEDGQRVRYDEVHEERGYYLEEIESCLQAAGFRQNDFYHHSTFQPPDSTTKRVMVVARKF